MFKPIFTLAAGLSCLIAQPALAAQAPEHPQAFERHPAIAAGLAVMTPMALMVVASRSTNFFVNFGVPVLGLAAGHIYAGEPLRGAIVAVGSTAAGVGAFALLNKSGGNGGGGAYLVGMASVAFAATLAASDAYWTAERKNREAAELGQLPRKASVVR